MTNEPLQFTDPRDSENVLTVAVEGETVCVSVAEEQAVDSYNETVSCSIWLDRTQAARLRDWLLAALPPEPARSPAREAGPANL